MRKELGQRWVAALRSGKFRQGKRALREGDTYCCLGVLCELAVADGAIRAEREANGAYYYDGSSGLPSSATASWAGMRTNDGSHLEELRIEGESLASRNDRGATFAEIADIIERNIDAL